VEQVTKPGQIVILNGAPRSGKSSIAGDSKNEPDQDLRLVVADEHHRFNRGAAAPGGR